jgi:protein-disulfide isomerase
MIRCLVALMIVLMASAVQAQAPQQARDDVAAIKADVERIKADLEVLKSQLGEVLRLVSQRNAGPAGGPGGGTVRTSVAGAPVLGRADAPVTIVEFSDYECPFCQRFFASIFPTLKKEYVDTGKVRYVFRDFPLDKIHPQARKAAEAAHCAGEQGKYWQMHEVLFRNPRALAPQMLAEHAQAAGADARKLTECLVSGRYAAQVSRGLTDGAAIGVKGTPTFVVGKTATGDVVQGTAIRGTQPLETFRRIIEQTLMEQ